MHNSETPRSRGTKTSFGHIFTYSGLPQNIQQMCFNNSVVNFQKHGEAELEEFACQLPFLDCISFLKKCFFI